MSSVEAILKCPRCGTDMDLTDFQAACPSCGRRLADLIDVSLVDPATRLVAADVPCVSCQYNLRTIPIDSRCPECATAVTASLRRRDLRHADVAWLRRTRRGLFWLALAFLVSIMTEAYQFGLQRFISQSFTFYYAVYFSLNAAMMVFLLLGCFAVTQPDRAGQPERPAARGRLLRFVALAMLAIDVLGWSFPFIRYAWINGPKRLLTAGFEDIFQSVAPSFVGLGLWLVSIVLLLAFLLLINLHLRALAIRANRPATRIALSILLGVLAIHALSKIAATIVMMAIIGTGGPLASWYAPVTCAERATEAVISITLLVACLRLGRAFRQAIAAAKRPIYAYASYAPPPKNN